ncbi:multiple epidermal growth factor-like domains protein 6 [Prionailurus iriomotensis]
MGYCPKGVYGAGCSSECQYVEENTLECSAKNGSRTCKSGYQGNRCQKVCPPGTYGKDCKQVCQCSAENEKCHPVAGRYTCLPGYHGNRCHLRCPEGTYDLNCQRMHKYLNGGSCDTVIGTYHCLPGFIGADCSQTCPEDHHGRDCVQPCSCGSGQCDPVTGRCQCPPGKMRARCQQAGIERMVDEKSEVLDWKRVSQTMCGPNCELKCTCKNGGLCNPVDGSCTCYLRWTGNYCGKVDYLIITGPGALRTLHWVGIEKFWRLGNLTLRCQLIWFLEKALFSDLQTSSGKHISREQILLSFLKFRILANYSEVS